MNGFDHIVKRAMAAFEPILRAMISDAYEAGKVDATAAARTNITKAVEQAVSAAFETPLGSPPVLIATSPQASKGRRARRGSAKPVVLQVLTEHPRGISAKDAFAILSEHNSGLAENTVRATLNKLRAEGKAYKNGDKWFANSDRRSAPEQMKAPGMLLNG